MKNHYHILALDGGGIRGVLTATILERLEAEFPGFISHVNLFAGTSTGGILALGLAAGKTPTEMRILYETMGQRVFANNRIRTVEQFDQWVEADYPNEPLKKLLTDEFQAKTLGELRAKVIITSFNLDNKLSGQPMRHWKPKIFNNFEGDPDCREKVVDVALRTSAAPTYFSIYQGHVDGGVVANNPSLCAYAQVISKRKSGARQARANVRMLSLGTGMNLNYINIKENDTGNWGRVQWAMEIVPLMLEGSVELVHYQCREILGRNYYRLNPVIHEPIALDDVRKVEQLKQIAENIQEETWRETLQWVKKNMMPESNQQP